MVFYCNDNDNCYSQTTICGYDDDDYDSEPVKVVMMMIKKTFAAIMMKITKFMVGLVKITMMVVEMNVRMMMMMKIILTGYNKDDDDK